MQLKKRKEKKRKRNESFMNDESKGGVKCYVFIILFKIIFSNQKERNIPKSYENDGNCKI